MEYCNLDYHCDNLDCKVLCDLQNYSGPKVEFFCTGLSVSIVSVKEGTRFKIALL